MNSQQLVYLMHSTTLIDAFAAILREVHRVIHGECWVIYADLRELPFWDYE